MPACVLLPVPVLNAPEHHSHHCQCMNLGRRKIWKAIRATNSTSDITDDTVSHAKFSQAFVLSLSKAERQNLGQEALV